MKKATTIDEQIRTLKERNVIITDEEKAKEILLDIGYYRLGFYLFPFECSYPNLENRSHIMKEGTDFMNAVHPYYFDFDLRNILLRYIARIEVAFRTYLTYYVSNKYRNSPTWFIDTKVVEPNYLLEFNQKVYTEDFKKHPVIKHHHDTYINDRYAPAWKTIELMSFGAVYKLYLALKNPQDQLEIAMHFGFRKVDAFKNFIRTIVHVRNKCAHGNAIFDMTLPFGVQSVGIGKIDLGEESSISTAIRVILHMLGKISVNRKLEMQQALSIIYKKTIQEDAKIEHIIKKVIKM